jgi:hypothetical protein
MPPRFLKEVLSWFDPGLNTGLNTGLTVILAGQLEFLALLGTTPGPDHQTPDKKAKKQDRFLPEPRENTTTAAAMTPAQGKPQHKPAGSPPEKETDAYPVFPPPEPDAVIDWLLEKKNRAPGKGSVNRCFWIKCLHGNHVNFLHPENQDG